MADTLLTAELDATHTAPTFAELGVREEIVRALAEIGIERTFAIQELTLPLALAGEDLIGQARTGMGKTFGFGVPLLHRIATADSGTTPLDGTPRALVIVPTRELCIQVTADLENASKHLSNHKGKLQVASIYGGRPYESQIAALRDGVDVVVGTPGRLLDLAKQNHLILGKIGVLVLDEADEMLDLGFLPDIERILTMVPEKRQTMLFSATMPGPIITLARTFLTRPTHIRAEEPHDSAVHDRTAQFVYRAHALDKSELIARVLQAESRGATMIFTRTKRTAQKVADDLAERGFAVGAVHGDLGQIAREKALTKFRKGTIDVLVATDVAARGIDIDDVTHVVNYQCPEDEKTYVHRIGRTGRAGRTGVAVTLIDWDELNRWAAIDTALGLGIPDPVETYSRSPHLFADLGIPEGVTGTVRKPRPAREEDDVVVEREARSPRKRNRRRTRGGKPLDGAEAGTESTVDADGTDAEANGAEPNADEGRSRRRRRRRRSGGAEGADNGVAEVAAEGEPTENAGESAEAETTEAPARRRRRRRKSADANGAEAAENGVAETAAAVTDETAAQAETSAPAAAETTAAVQAETAAPGATETAVQAEPTTAVAEDSALQAESTASAADDAEAPVRPETAAVADETPAVAEEAPAKPVRRRTRKTATAESTDNGTAENGDGAAAEPVKRRRTRKKADEVVDGNGDTPADAEAAEKPVRRRRRKADEAEASEAVAATAGTAASA
ncbi:superfamily II DNA/RNA helicase [Nocardia bhagyanarayanae]|uniref:Superfamily II DNA/RNA helicase n=1 Tax=Nocardia bhagyanarayanae TaxID=1215925 RepID=A0A543FAT0_9NOCA|nr:superfamily II DNA/RNA helicase [Nocardia bhagyanarayanae]